MQLQEIISLQIGIRRISVEFSTLDASLTEKQKKGSTALHLYIL